MLAAAGADARIDSKSTAMTAHADLGGDMMDFWATNASGVGLKNDAVPLL